MNPTSELQNLIPPNLQSQITTCSKERSLSERDNQTSQKLEGQSPRQAQHQVSQDSINGSASNSKGQSPTNIPVSFFSRRVDSSRIHSCRQLFVPDSRDGLSRRRSCIYGRRSHWCKSWVCPEAECFKENRSKWEGIYCEYASKKRCMYGNPKSRTYYLVANPGDNASAK